jgi:hypothetical protein
VWERTPARIFIDGADCFYSGKQTKENQIRERGREREHGNI